MHGELPGRRDCLSVAVSPSLWQMVPGHITYVPCAPTAPLTPGPWPSLSAGTGRFAGAALGTAMRRCFGLSVPQFPHLRCSYHGMAAGWDGCQCK